jgi:transcriptional regulator with XRE-family HTH domain
LTRVSPTVSQFEFAARIRRLREARGLGAKAVANYLGFSRNFLSAVENNKALLSPEKLPLLFEVLAVGEDEAGELTRLLHEARQPAWWQPYASSLPEEFLRFVGLELGCSAISSFESRVFHGLLQCEAYASGVIGASPNISDVQMKRTLDVRLQRQDGVLKGDRPPAMTFVMGEAVLMQQIGGPTVLRAQLLHVLDLAQRLGDSLDLRIQRFDATPLGLGSASTLVLLDFDSPYLEAVAWREAATPVGLSSEPGLIEMLKLHFTKAVESSCGREESLQLVAQRAGEMDGRQ